MNAVDQYISNYEPEIQSRLSAIRQLFFKLYPDCEERISYQIPAYKVGKESLYFAAYKNHIGFYPLYGLEEIEQQLEPYKAKGTKNSLHFSHDKTLPLELIKKIIQLKFK